VKDFRLNFVQALMASARGLLVASSAVLGVATSLLAADPWKVENWLLLAGSGILVYIADRTGDLERLALTLSTDTGTDLSRTRKDIAARDSESRVFPVALLGIASIVISLVLGPSNAPSSGSRETGPTPSLAPDDT
jgi:hypothetical protein